MSGLLRVRNNICLTSWLRDSGSIGTTCDGRRELPDEWSTGGHHEGARHVLVDVATVRIRARLGGCDKMRRGPGCDVHGVKKIGHRREGMGYGVFVVDGHGGAGPHGQGLGAKGKVLDVDG